KRSCSNWLFPRRVAWIRSTAWRSVARCWGKTCRRAVRPTTITTRAIMVSTRLRPREETRRGRTLRTFLDPRVLGRQHYGPGLFPGAAPGPRYMGDVL